jgi:hypothetical protein
MNRQLRLRYGAIPLLMAALAACSGGVGSRGLVPNVPASAAPAAGGDAAPDGETRAALTILVPRSSSTAKSAGSGKHPAYVSPSSATLGVTINGGAATSYGLTPRTPGCATLATVLSCTFAIVVPPGHDTLGLTLVDAAGNVLSRNVVATTIAAGTSTPVSVTLAGVPAAVQIVPGTGAYSDTLVAPYNIPGLFPVPVEVEALDADGNIIVGPGAPTLNSVTSSSPTVAPIAAAVGTDPFAYVLSPNGSAGGKSVTIAATVQGIPLADGTTSAPVSGSTQYAFTPALLVGSGIAITAYSVAKQTAFAEFKVPVTGGAAIDDLTADSQGRFYALVTGFEGFGLTSAIDEYAAGATAPEVALGTANGAHSVDAIALDSHADLFSANGNTGSIFGGTHVPPSITEYSFGATAASFTLANTFAEPLGVAVDKSGNVFESDGVSATIAKYPRASQTQSATLSDPSLAGPSRMVTDASGGLYVVDSVNNDIAYFAAGQTALTTTLSDPSFANGIGALLIDPSGNLWVSVTNSGTTERLAAVSLPNAAVIDETLPQSGYLGYVP